jgi:hypothetical protein
VGRNECGGLEPDRMLNMLYMGWILLTNILQVL